MKVKLLGLAALAVLVMAAPSLGGGVPITAKVLGYGSMPATTIHTKAGAMVLNAITIARRQLRLAHARRSGGRRREERDAHRVRPVGERVQAVHGLEGQGIRRAGRARAPRPQRHEGTGHRLRHVPRAPEGAGGERAGGRAGRLQRLNHRAAVPGTLGAGHRLGRIEINASLTTTMEGARKAALAQMVLVTALFGGTWPAGKIAVDHLPPLTVAAVRFVLATVLLFALAVALVGLVIVVDPTGRGGRRPPVRRPAAGWARRSAGPSSRSSDRRRPPASTPARDRVRLGARNPGADPVSVTGWGSLAHADAAAWLSLLYLAPLGTVLAFVLYYGGVQRLGAARTAAFTLLVPVVGLSSSIVVLGEPLRAGLVVGGAIVLAGLWLVQRPARPRRVSVQVPAVAVPRPACQEAHSRA